MIKRILVPLDGSTLAERALVTAGGLAESLAGTVVLLRVAPPAALSEQYAPGLAEQVETAQVREAEEYLGAVAQRLRADRLTAETHVIVGPPAPSIVREAKRLRCDLIVLTSHGMGGRGARVFGSVALKLLHSAACPVLVVPATAEELEAEEEMEERAADESLLRQIASPGRRSGG